MFTLHNPVRTHSIEKERLLVILVVIYSETDHAALYWTTANYDVMELDVMELSSAPYSVIQSPLTVHCL